MRSISAYCLLGFMMSLSVVSQSQTHLFYERISEEINADTLLSVVNVTPGEFYFISQSRTENVSLNSMIDGKLQRIELEDTLDLRLFQLSSYDGSLVLLRDDRVYGLGENEMVELDIPIDQIIYPEITVEKGILTTAGSLRNVKVISYPEGNQRYLFHKKHLYQYDISANEHFQYWMFDEVIEHSSLIALPVADDRMVLSFYHPNKLFIYDNEQLIDILDQAQNQAISAKERLYYHAVAKGDFVYFNADDFSLNRLDLRDLSLKIVNSNVAQLKNIFIDSKERIWIGSKFGEIFEYDEQANQLVSRFNKSRKKIDTFRSYEDSNGWIWWGFHNGLTVSIPEADKFFYYHNQVNQTMRNDISISAIQQIGDKLYTGTYSEGAFVFDYTQIEKEIRIAINQNTEVNWDNVSVQRLPYFHENNINEIEYFNSTDDILGVRTKGAYYTIQDDLVMKVKETGYFASIQNFFSKPYGDRFLLSIPGGFCTIDLQATQDITDDHSYYISHLLGADEQKLDYVVDGEDVSLSISDNIPFIRIQLSSKNPTSLSSSYKYRIDHGDWKTTSFSEVIFASPDLGDHRLEIKRVNDVMLSRPKIINIHIYQKWYESTWFKALIAGSFIFLLGYIIMLFNREKKLQQSIKSMETESLRSYMNPHFISNSLNSINFYILDNKKDEASQYLIKFSNLIRNILNHTDHEFVGVAEEIKTLELYLDMEKLRFKDKFSWDIQIDDSIDLDYQIPTMVIQPLIENAIWHGVKQADNSGTVLLQMTPREKGIQVTILDDGIGLSASKELNSKGAIKRKSFGTKLIKKRLNLLNDLHGKDYSMTISDRSDGVSGTIVILNL